MLRNIVFDMGGVLLEYEPMKACLHFAPTREDAEAVNNALFHSPEWEQKIDACLISEADMLELAQSRLPTPELRELCARIFKNYHEYTLTPIEGMEELVRWLHAQGFRIFLLSNVGASFARYGHRLPGRELFDGLVLSGEEHILKPSAEIFERLCERFDLKPEECLFVDDREVNVASAQKLGMQGFVFTADNVDGLTAFIKAQLP